MLPDGTGIRVGGWKFTSRHGPIAADSYSESLKQDLEQGLDVPLTIPEQLFDWNRLEIQHIDSGVTINFNAEDALRAWREDMPPAVEVSTAREWKISRKAEMEAHNAKKIEYDWTFTTPYTGTVTRDVNDCSNEVSQSSERALISAGETCHSKFENDTFTAHLASESEESNSCSNNNSMWIDTSELLDRTLLTNRDPILFFDEVALYESELEDNGISQLSVKIRVMPKCWYVLLRFFMRVDHVMVRLREIRFFSAFKDNENFEYNGSRYPKILREIKHHEGTFDALRNAGAPPEGPAYSDADSASVALMAIAPIGLQKYEMKKLHL